MHHTAMKRNGSKLDSAPEGNEIRELKLSDFDDGFLATLGNLSSTDELSPEEGRKILKRLGRTSPYHVLVAVTGGQVVGATTLLVEQKFIHNGGLVGHIEDVTVRKGYEGRGLGGSLVTAAVRLAEELGCYKVILDCKEGLVGFYEGLGFRKHDVGMRRDLKQGPVRIRS